MEGLNTSYAKKIDPAVLAELGRVLEPRRNLIFDRILLLVSLGDNNFRCAPLNFPTRWLSGRWFPAAGW